MAYANLRKVSNFALMMVVAHNFLLLAKNKSCINEITEENSIEHKEKKFKVLKSLIYTDKHGKF